MPVPARQPDGLSARSALALLSPWSRLSLLVLLLGSAATLVLWHQPERLLADGWSFQTAGAAAPLVFALAYGVLCAALAPRPLLNLAAGALLGAQAGTLVALAGTVLAAGLSFGLGRLLGQEALRSLLRPRWLKAADRQLSRHGFRSVLLMRLVPGVPFAVSNYGSAVSRMRWLPFLAATGLGSIPNTGAYVVAGSHATTPSSPTFLAALGFITLSALGTVAFAWRKRVPRATAAAPSPDGDRLSETRLSLPRPRSDDHKDASSPSCLGSKHSSSDSSRG